MEIRFVGQSAHRQDYDRDVVDWLLRVHEQLTEYFNRPPVSSQSVTGEYPADTVDVIHPTAESDHRKVSSGVEQQFVPRPPQKLILKALEWKALKTDALAKVVKDRRSLFNRGKTPGYLTELKKFGLVENHPRLGYFRPDMPPPELRDLD